MRRPRKGWVRARTGRVERYRYSLGNGRMLMVVGHSPRKWYYGECAEVRSTRWQPAGMEVGKRLAMRAAMAMVGRLVKDQGEMIDEDAYRDR